MKPKAKKASPTPVTFETAMGWLRRGKLIRRRAWHANSLIFRLRDDVFVKLPNGGPQKWQPYSNDFLATDWSKV